MKQRCHWCTDDPLYIHYHDEEWGVPQYADDLLFEFLILESWQAGLSWITILRKREFIAQALAQFDPYQLARFTPRKEQQLLQNPNIIRNKAKIHSAIVNAQAFLNIQQQGSFSDFIWQFVDGEPQQNHWRRPEDIPSSTPTSTAMAKSLKDSGFSFVGPTICYAYMQACGLVNDHLHHCFRHSELA